MLSRKKYRIKRWFRGKNFTLGILILLLFIYFLFFFWLIRHYQFTQFFEMLQDSDEDKILHMTSKASPISSDTLMILPKKIFTVVGKESAGTPPLFMIMNLLRF